MSPPSPPPWKRRPIFLWQLRILILITFLSLLLLLPSTPLPHHPTNPCDAYPTPLPLPATAPTLLFPHIPKTAGTSLHPYLKLYSNRTSGSFCQLPSHTSTQFTSIPSVPHVSQCRAITGHVSLQLSESLPPEQVLSIVLMREPLARFVSWYEYARGAGGWGDLFGEMGVAMMLGNSTAVVNKGYTDKEGQWRQGDLADVSFGFYGALWMLSGIKPRFLDEHKIFFFSIANERDAVDIAKTKICQAHVVGVTEHLDAFWNEFFERTGKWGGWKEEKEVVVGGRVNRTPGRESRNLEDHLPERVRQEVERRLEGDKQLWQFVNQVAEYRKWKRASA